MFADVNRMRKLRIGVVIAALAALAACGNASDISARNANYIGVSLKDSVMSGTYNPAGFDTRLVQNQIKSLCVDKTLGGYAEKPEENGLVAFSATCAGGATLKRAFMEIERMPNGNFAVEVTGS